MDASELGTHQDQEHRGNITMRSQYTWKIVGQPRIGKWDEDHGCVLRAVGFATIIGMPIFLIVENSVNRLNKCLTIGSGRAMNNGPLHDLNTLSMLRWPYEIDVKYTMFASGADLARRMPAGKALRLDGYETHLYMWDRETFFVGFAQICYDRCRFGFSTNQLKLAYLREALTHLNQADALRNERAKSEYGLWARDSQLFKDVTKALAEVETELRNLDPSATISNTSLHRSAAATNSNSLGMEYSVETTTDNTALITAAGYQITFDRAIGDGASGIVYAGRWNQQVVAIKRFNVSLLQGDGAREFLSEASMMMTLESEYLVHMHDFIASPPHYCMVMEYMPKGSLYNVLGSDIELPWDKRWVIAMDIAYGVEELHSRNIIHRDIKSLNVLLDDRLRAKVADFGQAKLKTTSRSTKSKREQTGAVGTVAWLAPEIVRGDVECNKASDMYSLGMLFWELGTRQRPFANAHSAEVMALWVSQGKKEDLSKVEKPRLAHLIRHCWEQPGKRPTTQQTLSELMAAKGEDVAYQSGGPEFNVLRSRLPAKDDTATYQSGGPGFNALQSRLEKK